MNGKKRILFFAPSNGGTTIAALSLNLLKALQARLDVEVKPVIIYRYPNGNFNFGDCEFFAENNKGFSLVEFIRKIFWFRKIKRDFKPDVTINTLFICSIISVISGGKDVKIGVFHSPHQQAASVSRFNLFMSFLSYHFIYPHLDKLFCVSRDIYNSIRSQFKHIPESKIEIVYNIHDFENIDILAMQDAQENQIVDFTSSKVLLFCGRLDNNKAPMRLLKAFNMVVNKIPDDFKLVYMGRDYDNLWPDMYEFITKNNIADRVFNIGVQKNPYPYIAKANALISCSYSEGLPGVLIEAKHLKIPVIATNSSLGIWEILSVEQQYSVNISENYIVSNDIITPNRAALNSKYEPEDILKLSEAILLIASKNRNAETFTFQEKLRKDYITERYLSV